jgi:hypothetical protein
MFLKCRSRENENESQRYERGFFSQQTNIQKPLPVCTQCFDLRDIGQYLSKHISRNFCLFQPPHKFEFEIIQLSKTEISLDLRIRDFHAVVEDLRD